MIDHKEDTPLIFYLSELDSEMVSRMTEWFLLRRPEHFIRRLVNRERDDHGKDFELIFSEKRDAMEFKLTFL